MTNIKPIQSKQRVNVLSADQVAEMLPRDDPRLLASVDRQDGLIEATNADFEAIRDLAIELGFLR